jgi:PAS domain S-box-containing protein
MANFRVAPGSHMYNKMEIPADKQPDRWVDVLCPAGGCVFFDRRLWHRATPNLSDVTRKALFYGYSYRYKHKMDQRLREQKDWLESVLNSISESIITTDRLGRVIYMNSTAEGLTGWLIHQAKNRPIVDVFNLVDSATGNPVDSAVSDPFQIRSNTISLVARSGQQLPVNHAASPLNDSSGHHGGYVITFRLRE